MHFVKIRLRASLKQNRTNTMNLTDIANRRLINQQIQQPQFESVKKLVDWMGALQAQDYGMPKWR